MEPTHDHAHDHSHTHHSHSHGHEHSHDGHHHHHHDDEDPYYVDQLSQIALTSAFGGICLLLYFVRTEMLDLMLSSRFNIYVLAGGLVLLSLALIRAFCLWGESRAEACADCHAHDHDHLHAHDDGHDHSHEHGQDGSHAHGHTHAHGHHHHHHGHGHDDHDHGWAPWRYVVLMVPVILFVLGLPNKAPAVVIPTGDVQIEHLVDARAAATFVSLAPEPFAPVMSAATLLHVPEDTPMNIPFRRLFDSQGKADERDLFKNKFVMIKGKFRGQPGSDKVGYVARFLRQCCSADMIQITIPIVSKQSMAKIADDSWVIVRGRVDYQANGALRVIVPTERYIQTLSRPDESPFIDN